MISNINYDKESEKQNQLRKEMGTNYRIEQALKEEKEEEERKKRELIAREYDDYLKGQEHKHYKMLKTVQDKLEPTLVSLPLNSEERLRKWKEDIERKSEMGEMNGKLYNDFKAKSRATSHYNYLTKRYSLNNKVVPDFPNLNTEGNENKGNIEIRSNYNSLSTLNNLNNNNIPITPRYSSDDLQYQQQANLNYLTKQPENVVNEQQNINVNINNDNYIQQIPNDIVITKDNNSFDNYQFKSTQNLNSTVPNDNYIIDKNTSLYRTHRNINSSNNINSNYNLYRNNNINLNNSYIISKPMQRSFSNNSFYQGVQNKNPQILYTSQRGKREGTDITNDNYFDHYYNNTYGSYKEINKQYEDYNKSLVAQNERFKEEMILRRKEQEEIRRLERERLARMQQLQKMYDDDLKRQYRQYLDQQVVQQLPRKLMDEGYTKEALTENTNLFQNEYLYVNAPEYNLINKSKFVEVNPYNPKKYDLGETILQNNTILNPAFNYRFNKYIVPLDKEMREGEKLFRNAGMKLVNNN